MKKAFSLFLFSIAALFTYGQSISSISPNSANAGQTLNVTITGTNTNFQQGSGTYVDFNFISGSGTSAVNYTNIVSDTKIIANITIPSNTYTGYYDVTLSGGVEG